MSELGLARHRARERALELLYEQAIKDRPIDEILAQLAIAPDPYTVTLLHAVTADRAWADDLLARHSTEWPLERMSLVDRLIMTIALCEMRTLDAPPRAVVMNEAVELARMYSGDNAPTFVNGLLAACLREIEDAT